MKRPGAESALRLAFEGGSRNITLKLEDISKRLVKNVPDLLIDLIEIATYVYCADQTTSRGGECQSGMGVDWRREFRFVVPVRNPRLLGAGVDNEALCDALSFLTDDDYVFEFEKATNLPVLKATWSLAARTRPRSNPIRFCCFQVGSIPWRAPLKSYHVRTKSRACQSSIVAKNL